MSRGPCRGPSAGRSPRARGSPYCLYHGHPLIRSIPACAGKPEKNPCRRPKSQVDPRVRGEAVCASLNVPGPPGRSPRARGSHIQHLRQLHRLRSIPACAGKPAYLVYSGSLSGVDPRVRGEAIFRRDCRICGAGRSPRARGSPSDGFADRRLAGSIPACAGKPKTTSTLPRLTMVDPRVRGEAFLSGLKLRGREGRSPRARGSLRKRQNPTGQKGSIPACAGKPPRSHPRSTAPEVDPRVRGEARVCANGAGHHQGRSPRARGSPRDVARVHEGPRSIPACAGKPAGMHHRRCSLRVDPRVRGEAAISRCPAGAPRGRSPRARGSRPRGTAHERC